MSVRNRGGSALASDDCGTDKKPKVVFELDTVTLDADPEGVATVRVKLSCKPSATISTPTTVIIRKPKGDDGGSYDIVTKIERIREARRVRLDYPTPPPPLPANLANSKPTITVTNNQAPSKEEMKRYRAELAVWHAKLAAWKATLPPRSGPPIYPTQEELKAWFDSQPKEGGAILEVRKSSEMRSDAGFWFVVDGKLMKQARITIEKNDWNKWHEVEVTFRGPVRLQPDDCESRLLNVREGLDYGDKGWTNANPPRLRYKMNAHGHSGGGTRRGKGPALNFTPAPSSCWTP